MTTVCSFTVNLIPQVQVNVYLTETLRFLPAQRYKRNLQKQVTQNTPT